MRSDDPKLFPPDKFPPNELEIDTTSGPSAPDLELFYLPFAVSGGRNPTMPAGVYDFGLHTTLLRFVFPSLSVRRRIGAKYTSVVDL